MASYYPLSTARATSAYLAVGHATRHRGYAPRATLLRLSPTAQAFAVVLALSAKIGRPSALRLIPPRGPQTLYRVHLQTPARGMRVVKS